MNKIFLVIQREFMSRVKKKSFLLATIIVPLIFPAVIGVMVYVKMQEDENKEQETIQLLNESELVKFEDSDRYEYVNVDGPLDSAKANFSKSDAFALIYVPAIELDNPEGSLFP